MDRGFCGGGWEVIISLSLLLGVSAFAGRGKEGYRSGVMLWGREGLVRWSDVVVSGGGGDDLRWRRRVLGGGGGRGEGKEREEIRRKKITLGVDLNIGSVMNTEKVKEKERLYEEVVDEDGSG